MAWANFSPIGDTSVGVIVMDAHGTFSIEMVLKFYSKSVSWGKPSPNIVLNIQEFDDACSLLEKHPLIGYFVGQTPKSVLKEWVAKTWNPHRVKLEGI